MSRRFLKQNLSLIGTLVLMLGINACGDGDPLPDDADIKGCKKITNANRDYCEKREVDDAISFKFNRQYFQPRDPVVFGIEEDIISYGKLFSVGNLATDAIFLKNEPIKKGLQEHDVLKLYDDTNVRVYLYPTLYPETDFVWLMKPNHLRVYVQNEGKQDFRYSDQFVYMYADTVVSDVPMGICFDDCELKGKSKNKTEVELWISDSPTSFVNSEDIGLTLGVIDGVNPGY